MGYRVTLDVGNRYTGVKQLIPGTVYSDKKGEKILFIGYSRIVRDEGTLAQWGGWTSFVYAKVAQLEKKIAKGLLTSDLRHYMGDDIDLTGLFYTSCKPRLLMSEEYQMFPSDYFEHFHMDQASGMCSYLDITTEPRKDVYICVVEKT